MDRRLSALGTIGTLAAAGGCWRTQEGQNAGGVADPVALRRLRALRHLQELGRLQD